MTVVRELIANWPAPNGIKALTTTRQYGFSQAPYDQNNLALHVHDQTGNVLRNRQQLSETYGLPSEPQWLDQIHSTTCVNVNEERNRQADAAITRDKSTVLAIMTADCLPILLCNQQGTEIAAIHAGWRGLLNGVIEQTLTRLNSSPDTLMAWIGPSICQTCYEVGHEVRAHYQNRYPQLNQRLDQHFIPSRSAITPIASLSSISESSISDEMLATQHAALGQPKWLTNLPGLAEEILHWLGIKAVYQSKQCTFERQNDFYSYRRAAQTGRIASLIWFT